MDQFSEYMKEYKKQAESGVIAKAHLGPMQIKEKPPMNADKGLFNKYI